MKAFILITEAYHRFKAPTPEFFKKVIKRGVTLGGVGTGLVTPAIAGASHWPVFLTNIGGHLIIIGAVAASIAKFACDDPDTLPTKTDSSPKN